MVRFGNVRRIWSNPVAIQYVHKTIQTSWAKITGTSMHMYKESLKLIFLLSFVTRCCSALDRGKIKPQKSTGKVLVRVQYIVMQSLVYIKRLGEYGTPVCTLGIHSITQLEGKNKNSSTRAEQVFNRFLVCPFHTRPDVSGQYLVAAKVSA